MLTTDFTGTYDYEKEEAEHAAAGLLEDLACGYTKPEDFELRLLKERAHWRKCLPDTFEDFDKHFREAIKNGLENALKSYIAQAGE